MRPAVIIPVYNHGRQVDEVVRKSLLLCLPVFVVDDGSTDGTSAILEAIDGITVLSHPTNQGKGAAILTGCSAALEKGCDFVLTIDGDGQHNPEEAGTLLAAAVDGQRCLVIGKRRGMAGAENVPWTSIFGRGFSNFWVWAAGGPLVDDSQSGFRLYPIPELLQIGVQARRYQFEVEVLVKARQHGIRIREVAISVVYQAKGLRVSHFQPWRDFLRNSTTFSRLIIARIFGVFRP